MLTLIFLVVFWVGISKFFVPMFNTFQKCVDAVTPAVKAAHKITGWSGPRHAYILLAASVVWDFIGEANSNPEYDPSMHYINVALWCAACIYGIEKMHKISITPPDETMQVTQGVLVTLVNMSMWIVFITPLSIYLDVADSTNTLGVVASYWEHILDSLLVLVAWAWIPPGKSLYARIKEKVKTFSFQLKPVLAPVPQ